MSSNVNDELDKTTLGLILEYFEMTRQVGHTTTVMNGAKDSNAIIVVGNQNQIRNIQRHDPKADVVPIGRLRSRLHGSNVPLVVDNVAWFYIMSELKALISEQVQRSWADGWAARGKAEDPIEYLERTYESR